MVINFLCFIIRTSNPAQRPDGGEIISLLNSTASTFTYPD